MIGAARTVMMGQGGGRAPLPPPEPMVVKMDMTSADLEAKLPLYGSVDVEIDWGDGNFSQYNSSYPRHTYATPGEYTITITGVADRLGRSTDDALWPQLTQVLSFGEMGFTSMDGAFAECVNLFSVSDDLPAGVTDFTQMFRNCTSLVAAPNINTEDGVVFNGMFVGCTSLTSVPLLDTSNGNTFVAMFSNCTSLTTIPQLDTSSGVNFSYMFDGSTALVDVPLLNTSAGTNFIYMFASCTSLEEIPLLDTSSGTNFSDMFSGCTSLTEIPLLDTSSGTVFNAMFANCRSLTSIPELDTSSGIEFGYMFNDCVHLTEVPLLDTSSGTNFSRMLQSCTSLTEIPELDTSSGTNFNGMLLGCDSLTTIPELDTSSGTDFGNMFYGCTSLTTIPELDTSLGTSFSYMFNGCTSLTEIPELDTSSGINFSYMFSGCTSLTKGRLNGTRYSISYVGCNLPHSAILDIFDGLGTAHDGNQTVTFTNNPGTSGVGYWDTEVARNKDWQLNPDPQITPMIVKMDMKSTDLTAKLPLSNQIDVTVDWGDGTTSTHTSSYPEHTYATAGEYTIEVTGRARTLGRGNFDAAQWPQLTEVVSFGELGFMGMPGAFRGCANLEKVADDLPGGVTDFIGMFHNCTALTTIPKLDTSSGTRFSNMFRNCSSLTEIPELDTSSGTNFGDMFRGCSSLTEIPELDTSSGTDFSRMFQSCTSLTEIPLLDTSSGTNFNWMFDNCTSLTTIPELDTSLGTRFDRMFSGCTSLTEIPLLDTSSGTNFGAMFYGCSSLTEIPELDTSSGTDFSLMFQSCSSLTGIPLLDTSSGTNFIYMFNGCTSLTAIPELDTSSGTNFVQMFGGCYSLTKGRLNGTRYSITYAGCNLSRSAIVDIVDGLGTAVDSSQTLVFGNNPGTAAVTYADVAPAYAKGWLSNPTREGTLTTRTYRVTSGNDATTYYPHVNWRDDGGTDYVYLVDGDNDPTLVINSNFRFTNIDIPQGATIISAKITLVSRYERTASAPAYVTIGAEQVDNSPAVTNASAHTSRMTNLGTTASWELGSMAENEAVDSADLRTVVQQIVNRSGWTSGNAITFFTATTPTARVWNYSPEFFNFTMAGGVQERIPVLEIVYA